MEDYSLNKMKNQQLEINNTMKLKLILFTIIAIVVTACGGADDTSLNEILASGDMSAIRAKKKELTEQQNALGKDIALIDSVISANDQYKKLPLITTLVTQNQKFDHFVEFQGDVTTKQNVLIYPEVAGHLIKVEVKEGQKVSKGQLLGVIDNGGLSSQLQQMRTQLALAKTTFERQKSLWEQKIGSEIQFLQAKTNYETQQNAVSQMESQLSKYSIRAPFSGIIDDVIKDQGTVVAPGGPGSEVFRIINLSDMYLNVDVPESYISSIKVGKEVKVYFPILNKTITSKVRQTGNYINPNNRSFSVEIPVPNFDNQVKPNMTAKVQINDYTSEEAILIPQSIISENAEGEQYAFVATNINEDKVGIAKKNIITTGKTQGDFVEVLSGLNVGDNVIQEGARSVKDGQEVKILMQ